MRHGAWVRTGISVQGLFRLQVQRMKTRPWRLHGRPSGQGMMLPQQEKQGQGLRGRLGMCKLLMGQPLHLVQVQQSCLRAKRWQAWEQVQAQLQVYPHGQGLR